MYNTLDTADVYSRGLVAYYPFEKLQGLVGLTICRTLKTDSGIAPPQPYR